MSTLLDRTFLHPMQSLGHAALHELTDITHPLVHAVEQPIYNVVNDSRQVVGGLYQATRGVMHLMPYWVGAWLLWSAFELYFPDEYTSVRDSVDRATKRMRLT